MIEFNLKLPTRSNYIGMSTKQIYQSSNYTVHIRPLIMTRAKLRSVVLIDREMVLYDVAECFFKSHYN